jgi:hypothetical protein
MAEMPTDQNRNEMLRRVQIGAAGLAGVLTLVALTGVVVDKARKDGALSATQDLSAALPSASNGGETQQPSEPLADLGVTPSTEEGTPAVPDLQPDPRLKKRMDRDPRQSRP